MDILYSNDRKRFLTYHKYNSTKKKAPFVIFHHGLMSNMDGSKAMWLENHCIKKDYSFIRFDNFGHGSASGKFSDQTITDWLFGLNLIIDHLAAQPVILVGSSMGAWITMLAAINHPKNIVGMIGISSAPDFSEELIWNNLTQKEKNIMQSDGVCDVSGSDPDCNHIYPISFDLIKDGRNHLLLNNKINISCPVHLLHGMQDKDVPPSISEKVFCRIAHDNVTMKLIKDGNHSLSRPKDLEIICNSLDEMIFSL
jgi:uncharacterized protein